MKELTNLITKDRSTLNPDLVYWNNKGLDASLILVCIFSLPAYGMGMYLSIIEGLYSIAILNTVTYVLLLIMCFRKSLGYKIRSLTLIILNYIICVGLIIILGPSGAGHTYLIAFVVFSSLFFRTRGAIISLSVVLITVVSIAIGLKLNLFGDLKISDYNAMHWITVVLNTCVIAAIASIALVRLLNGLELTITKQQTLQKQLEENMEVIQLAKLQAEESDMLKSRFLANISHEIRTPLNAILGFSELAFNDINTDKEDYRNYLQIINTNGQHLLKIIENILDYSLLESKHLKIHLQPTNINHLLNELQEIYQLKQSEKLHINFMIPNDEIIIKTDATQLKQVYTNLINNAIKFTPYGEITIGIQYSNKEILAFVKDTGIGIDQKHQINIFRRFIKLDNKDKFREGAGLGLSISKSIVEHMGGRIWVESTLNNGAIFYFSIIDHT